MRTEWCSDEVTRSSTAPGAVPIRLLTRVPLPERLAEAVGAAVEAQERQTDPMLRIALAIRMRRALEFWLDGALTSEQVVQALRVYPET
jgi:hypothetical protein